MKKYLLLIFSVVCFTQTGFSQTINWDGDNPIGNFSYCDNWYGNSCPTGFGGFNYSNELQFNFRNNASQTSTYFDLGWQNIKSLIYMGTYGSSTPLSGNGNGLNFDIKVENNSSFPQTVNIPLSGAKNGSTVIELNPVNADLTIGGILFNDNNKVINIYGSNSKVLKLNNYIVGNGSVNLNIKQNSKVVLNYDMSSQASAFSGGVNIDIGEFWFEQGASINGGTIKVGTGNANVAKLYISDADGGTTVNNAITVPASSTNSFIGGLNTSGTNIFSGTLTLSAPVTLEAWSGGAVNFTGGIGGSVAVNIGRISGAGTATINYITNTKTYSGLTTINAGALLKISSGGTIPSTNNITVNSSGTLQVSTNQTLNTLVNNGTIIIDPGVILTVGSISGTGTITGSSTSNLIITGTTSTTLNFTSGSRSLNNLSTNASVTLGTDLDLYGALTVSGSAVFDADGSANDKIFTLKSNATSTARVAAGASGGNYIIGNVVIERYTSDKRAWRLLSAPINSGQTIKQAWMENGVNNNGFGTHITTFTGDPNAANFDAEKPASSIRSFTNPGNNWTTTPNTTTAINNEQGYMLFVRGNRAINLNDITAHSAATLRITGTLKQGTQSAVSVPYSATDYTLVGNPFASPIDYEYLYNNSGSNLSSSFYIWDGNLAGTYGVGGYRLVTRTGAGTYQQTPAGGSAVANNSMRYIHSGQAFLANAVSGTLSLVINEASKATSVADIFPFTPTTVDEEMTINMSVVETDLSVNLADGIRAKYNAAYDAAVTGEDNRKLNNFNENIAVIREGANLIVERRPVIGTTDTTYLSISNMQQKNYQLDINTTNLNHTNLLGKIVDNFTASSSPVNLNGNTIFNFTVTADPASSATDRFKIVFYPQGTLPVTFTSIKAVQQANDIAVEWKVENQTNIKQYEVEKSTDCRSFTKVGTQIATGANGTAATYNWLDVHAVSGDNFYRVKSVGFGGDVQYTRIVKVRMGKGVPAITVYPNPVTDRIVTLQFTDMAKGNYTINLVNNLGQTVQSKLISHNGANAAQSFAIDRGVTKGNYQLKVVKPGGEKEVMKLVIAE